MSIQAIKKIDAIRKAYREIFESGLSISEVANELLKINSNQYAKQLAQFVVETKRGIPFTRK